MSQIQTILCLFIVVIIIVSMGMMFKNNMTESFKGINGTGLGYIGRKLDYKPPIPTNNKSGNLGYPGLQYVGVALPPPNYVVSSDDQPLRYGFPPIQTKSI